jgi:hypothetical protein
MINEQPGTFTPASGTVSVTLGVRQAELRQIIITSATSSTTFDAYIVNSNDREVYRTDNNTGQLIESFNIPIRENITLTVENASADEVFEYQITAVE